MWRYRRGVPLRGAVANEPTSAIAETPSIVTPHPVPVFPRAESASPLVRSRASPDQPLFIAALGSVVILRPLKMVLSRPASLSPIRTWTASDQECVLPCPKTQKINPLINEPFRARERHTIRSRMCR